jgi:hypothetical protein
MLVEDELSLDFSQQDLLPVQFLNFLRSPLIRKEAEFVLNVDCVHGFLAGG